MIYFNSKTTAEDRAKRNSLKDNPFITRPNKGRKGKVFGQRLKRKTQPTVLKLQDEGEFQVDIEDKIASTSKLRNKRQVNLIEVEINLIQMSVVCQFSISKVELENIICISYHNPITLFRLTHPFRFHACN